VGARRLELLDSLKQWMTEHPANTNRDIIPRVIWRELAVPAMRAAQITTREMMRSLDSAYCGTSIFKQNISRERASRLAEAVKSVEIAALADSHIYWDCVESITPAGEEEVFDLTVPGHHNFIAADFVVHNSIEQDADLVGFIFREEVYKRDREDLRGLAELILAKQRNGPIGKIDMVFLHSLTKFENRAEDLGDLPAE
jgi:replicative DNA helicase